MMTHGGEVPDDGVLRYFPPNPNRVGPRAPLRTDYCCDHRHHHRHVPFSQGLIVGLFEIFVGLLMLLYVVVVWAGKIVLRFARWILDAFFAEEPRA